MVSVYKVGKSRVRERPHALNAIRGLLAIEIHYPTKKFRCQGLAGTGVCESGGPRYRARPVPGLPPPPATAHALRTRATLWLAGATCLWGLSFPLAKTLTIAQHARLPGADSWFLAAVSLVVRFGLAGTLLALGSLRTWRTVTHREWSQGLGLGAFASGGLLLQLDGLNYTAASTSSFLTSCYCVIIPVIVACQRRRWPPALVAGSCALVLAGMAILVGVDWRTLRLGRGEWETVLSSCFFAAQIFWLERPGFAANRTTHATVIMFGTIAIAMLPVLGARCRTLSELAIAAAGSGPIMGLLIVLTLLCTLATFTVMNHWQRFLEATEAGLIYCVEPVSASLCALVLPAALAAWAGVRYDNESFTWRLLVGGTLITVANLCIQWKPKAVTPVL